MADNKIDLQQATQNIELKIVQDNIRLLQQYTRATDENTKNEIKKQMHKLVQGLLERNYTPEDLITRLEKAIKLNKFRPHNLSLFLLAKSNDLDNISGDFDTFDPELAKLSKDTEKNGSEIRKKFNAATVNRFDLSKQFVQDWIGRLIEHSDLMKEVRTAVGYNKIPAYNNLFQALAKDFCNKYDIPEKSVDVKVVKTWATSDIKPIASAEETAAFVKDAWSINMPPQTTIAERNAILEKLKNSPQSLPNASVKKMVRVNFSLAEEMAQKFRTNLFVIMMANFAHEMNHVLDSLKPREGALGPQVKLIDQKTYVDMHKDKSEYYQSATELSSYEITQEMIEQLKSLNRY